MSQKGKLCITPKQAAFLTSLYEDQYSEYPPELRTQTSLLLASLFCNDISLVSIFDDFGLLSLVYPLFPHFKIPSFLPYYAERCAQCAKYLIEKGFIPKLISLLSLSSSEIDTEEDIIENDGNLIDYILCAGSIGNFSTYEDQLLPLSPVLSSIIVNMHDWKIQCEAINSLSILLKNSEKAANFFLSNVTILNDIICPSKCESNLYYLTSVINLSGSLLNYPQFLNEELYEKLMTLFSSSLNLFKDKCYKNDSFEACIKLIANALTDACSDDNPDLTTICLNIGIIQTLFEIFHGQNSWNLKIHIFDAILTLFSHSFPNIETFIYFIQLGVIDLLSDNLSEMCPCNGYAITSALNSIIMFLTQIGPDENQKLVGFLLSEEIEEAIDMLSQSDDFEIKNNAEKINLFVQSLLVDKK